MTHSLLQIGMQTWQFLNFLFNRYIKFKNWTFWNHVLKPDVLYTWRFVNLTFWNRTFWNQMFWNLKPDVLWVYQVSTNLRCNIVEKAGWTLLHHVLDAHAHLDVLNQPPEELDEVLPFPYNGKMKCRVDVFLLVSVANPYPGSGAF